MADYYVGKSGSDGNNGTTWALRKVTVDAGISLATTAGDRCIVGPGVYRETVTFDASGTSGNLIELYGDESGELTDGIGGEVVISGSDDDESQDRATVVSGGAYNYTRMYQITIEAGSGDSCPSFGTNCELEACRFMLGTDSGEFAGPRMGDDAHVWNCEFIHGDNETLYIDSNCTVEGCVFVQCEYAIRNAASEVGNQVLNNLFLGCKYAFVQFATGLTGGDVHEFNGNIVSTNQSGTNYAGYSGDAQSLTADSNHVGGTATWNNTVPTNNTVTDRILGKKGGLLAALAPSGRGVWVNGGGTLSSQDDYYGNPRSLGAGADWGPVQSNVSATFGASGMVCTDVAVRDFEVPVEDGVAITVDCDVAWSGAITSKPQLILQPRYGVAVQTDTATGSGSTEALSVTGTPTIPGGGNGIMKARLYAREVTTSVTFTALDVS